MPQSNRKPNIILILIDDMGWRDLSCYGSSFYETPHIDRLAAEGMRFTEAYAACPVCSPMRASLLTGKYPARVGVTDYIGGEATGRFLPAPYCHYLPLEEYSLARALKNAGYATWHIGKWHLGTEAYWPEHHGFDVNIGGCEIGAPFRAGYFSPWQIPTLPDGPKGEYLTDRLGAEAARLIRESRDDVPFFMYFSHYAVHTPLQGKPEDVRYFEEKVRRMGLDRIDPFEEGEPFPSLEKRHLRVKRRRVQSDPVYAAMIRSLDDSVGLLMNTLEAAGRADNTLVLFTSDNGGLATSEGSPTCNAPLAEGKGWMQEGGIREPLVAWWPGRVQAGTVCGEYLTSPDFYPTILEMAGLPPRPDQHRDGLSFRKLLEGGSLDRGPIFWHYPHYGNQGGTPCAAVRWGPWKLVLYFEDRRVALYNLKEDIGEEYECSRINGDVASRLANALDAWFTDVGARIPQANPAWTPAG